LTSLINCIYVKSGTIQFCVLASWPRNIIVVDSELQTIGLRARVIPMHRGHWARPLAPYWLADRICCMIYMRLSRITLMVQFISLFFYVLLLFTCRIVDRVIIENVCLIKIKFRSVLLILQTIVISDCQLSTCWKWHYLKGL